MRKIIAGFSLLSICLSVGAQAASIQENIAVSLEMQRSKATPSSLLPLISAVNESFANQDRNAAAGDLIELKFKLHHWRHAMALYINHFAKITRNKSEFILAMDELQKIHLQLPVQERADLLYSPLIYTVDDADTKKALIDFYTSQADLKNKNALLLESIPAIEKVKSGPQLDIDIRPIEPSSWSFAAWSQRKDFSNYYFEGEELKYRGLTLRSGDFILVNENSSADGLYTSINTPQSYFSHFGMLVFIKQDGNIFPAVFENHKKGVRAVPLSIFISEKFTSYAEIYRLPNQSADWADRLSDVALQVLQEVHAYDFTSQEKDRKYLNCANVGSLFLEKLSVKPIESKSTYLPKAFANMEILGMQPNIRMLSPTDYMKDPRVQFVGVVDNNLLPKLLADRLVENRFVELVSSKRLNPANFPFMYHLNMWGLQHIEDKDALGSLFLSYSGLTAETFPKGPNSLMAIIEVLEDEVNTASLQTLKDLGSLDTNDFSLKALESDEKSRAKIEAQLKDLESWFD